MIDAHCHLDLYQEPQKVADSCLKKGVTVISVTTTPKAWRGTEKLSEGNSDIITSLGFHPQLAHERYKELDMFDSILHKVKFVGEIGLDGGITYKRYFKKQKEVLRHILLSIKRAGGRIMSIHSAYAVSDILDELQNYSELGIPILHWFTGNSSELKTAVSQGCWFSVGPAMLRSQRGKDLFLNMPRDRIVSETDGPFAMANNKSLMPWDVNLAVLSMAKLWGISEELAQEKIENNFRNLLKIGHVTSSL